MRLSNTVYYLNIYIRIYLQYIYENIQQNIPPSGFPIKFEAVEHRLVNSSDSCFVDRYKWQKSHVCKLRDALKQGIEVSA